MKGSWEKRHVPYGVLFRYKENKVVTMAGQWIELGTGKKYYAE